MITAHRLTKKFGRFAAVDSVDFEIPTGEVVGFLGPNGAGKTTTIRMICGYLEPTGGRVLVNGLDVVRRRREIQRLIGYLPETPPLYAEMRVVEYLDFRARLLGMAPARRRTAVSKALARCWLSDVTRQPISTLSRGYRQRVGLAAALLGEPPVLILDEPTAGLDPAQIRQIRGLLRELAGEQTILLSTHILTEVELACDRIIMLCRGRIRAAGTINELQAAAAASARYILETDAADCKRALEAIGGVQDVQCVRLDDRWRRYTVTANTAAGDLRETISRAMAKSGGITRELQRDAPTLEALFVRMMGEVDP